MATTTDVYKLIVETDEALAKVQGLANAVTAAFTGMIGVVASFADEITDTADAFNATTAEVLALSAALGAAGGKGDNAVKIFKGINDSIAELNDGNLKTLKNFNELGISIGQLGSMSESDIRGKVITQLAEMENTTKRNELAFKMFGKAAVGVDWSKMASEIQANKEESERYAQAIEDAGQAYDSMAKMLKQVKMAFADAFNPVFKALAAVKVDTDTISTGFKVLATVLAGVVVPIVAIRTAITVATAAQVAFNTVANLNPWVRAGTLIVAGITAGATALGLFGDKQEEVNTKTEDQGKQIQKNAVDTSELTNKIKQQHDEVAKIGEEYRRNTFALREQSQLTATALGMSKTQQQIAASDLQLEQKLRSDIEARKLDFNSKDSDYQKNNKALFEEQLKIMREQTDEQKKVAAEKIKQEELNKLQEQQQLTQSNLLVSTRQELNKINDQYDLGLTFGKERIDLETKLNQAALLNSATQQEINNSNLLTLDEKKELLAIMAKSIPTLKDEVRLGELYKKANIDINQVFQDQYDKLEAIGEAQKKLYADTNTFKYAWEQAFNSYYQNATNAANQARSVFGAVTSAMDTLINDFVTNGTLDFKKFSQSIIQELIKIELKAQAMELWKMLRGGMGGGGGGGSMLGGLMSMFGGFFADGGQPPMNKASIVGENGPELFVPRSAGTIIPNGAMGGGGQQIVNHNVTNITNNVSALDAQSVSQLFAQNRRELFGVVEMARKEMPGR